MHRNHVFSCENFSVIPVIFIHKLKNKNSGVRFQERSIPVKYYVNSLNNPDSIFSVYVTVLLKNK